MVELGVEEYIGIEDFNSKTNPGAGVKPAFIFNGALFETNEDYKVFANIVVGTEGTLLVRMSSHADRRLLPRHCDRQS